jgi:2,4-dienoyl-CoA reductase-like NADH-dependent reductase (Old Yellow Enzyme family)
VVRRIVQIKRLQTRDDFLAHLDELGIAVAIADDADVARELSRPLTIAGRRLPNRFAVLPMEGWDGTADGRPSELVKRRWKRFGASGAALVWGGEAVAVCNDGRANPRQLLAGAHATSDLAELRALLLTAHAEATDGGPPPFLGLQLTHSGRWSRPDGEPRPLIAYRHPLLDQRVDAGDADVVSDGQLDGLVADFVRAAMHAREAGFDFVDVKHCHGYLLHELLSAVDRRGAYGGDLANRLRFLGEVVAGIRRDAPGLHIGVRVSAFDVVPYVSGADGIGVPAASGAYRYAFGGDGTGVGVDLTEVHELCTRIEGLGVELLSVTAGSPYSCPHVQRPAYFPPSDGYLPPRDPLYEVARLIEVTGELQRAHPSLAVVASGLSYLQEWLPAAGAAMVAAGNAQMIGFGRGVLSYPAMPRDVLAGRRPETDRVCRTFSDCTTAPRNGLVSGCYPLDDYYRALPERRVLAAAKREARGRS